MILKLYHNFGKGGVKNEIKGRPPTVFHPASALNIVSLFIVLGGDFSNGVGGNDDDSDNKEDSDQANAHNPKVLDKFCGLEI